MKWHVIYTKSRTEKSVASKLESSGYEVYCPLLKQRKLWSDRWKWVEEPLFRSYCFVKTEEQNREKVLQIPGVVRYIYFCGRPAVIKVQEIDALKNWLEVYEHDSINSQSFSENDKVNVKTGPLADKNAAIIRSQGNYAILYLEDLGLQVKVDLRKNLIEKI